MSIDYSSRSMKRKERRIRDDSYMEGEGEVLLFFQVQEAFVCL